MAWIDGLEIDEIEGKIHPTNVIAKVRTFRTLDARPVVQIDTYGSTDRAVPGKLSQTIQFGEDVAVELFSLLKRTYGFK